MFAKVAVLLCAQALLIQYTAGQCIGAGWPLAAAPCAAAAPWAAAPCAAAAPWAAAPIGAAGLYETTLLAPGAATASRGGSLPISSVSAIPPNGVSVASENAYAGELAVRGALPFLGTVGLEGALPTLGAAAVSYSCGNGAVTMLTEDIGAAAATAPLAYDVAAAPLGFRPFGYENTLAAPFARSGCGYGALY